MMQQHEGGQGQGQDGVVRSGVLAEEEVLSLHGARGQKHGSSITLQLKDWTFSSSHSIIATEADLVNIASSIKRKCHLADNNEARSDHPPHDDAIVIGGNHLHIPPMLFPQDIFTIQAPPLPHSGGWKLHINSVDALLCWVHKHRQHLDHSDSDGVGVGGFLEVPYAKEWSKRISDDMHSLVQQQWDWTFNTSYNFSFEHEDIEDGGYDVVNAGQMLHSSSREGAIHELTVPSAAVGMKEEAGRWYICDFGYSNELLKQRVDILFYDEMILYQDDLEDCGETKLLAKIRVMPTCWFILLRLYIRIDGGVIIMKDTRLFHDFSSDVVNVEVCWKQGEMNELEARLGFGRKFTSTQLRDDNYMSTLLTPAPITTPYDDCDSKKSSSSRSGGTMNYILRLR